MMLTRQAPAHGTLVDVLQSRARMDGGSPQLVFREGESTVELPQHRILDQASARAGILQAAGVEPGEPCLVLVGTSADFVLAFFGVILAGAVPCALPLPGVFGAAGDFSWRTDRIARYLGARHVITSATYHRQVQEALPSLQVHLVEQWQAVAEIDRYPFRSISIHPDDVALIQCTSGSTGDSKGVMLTHANLMWNTFQCGSVLDVRPSDRVVSWLPFYHDFGLIGCLLFSMYWNIGGVFLSPFSFLRRPTLWLQAISYYRGSLSAAPNFAFNYLTTRARDQELVGLNLSSWRVALCGAEPINPGTLRRFKMRFTASGLPANVVTTCYGLAEATVGVTIQLPGSPFSYDRLARGPLVEQDQVVDADLNEQTPFEVTNCGPPIPGTRVRVVDDDGTELADGRVGQVQVKGPQIMKGYFNLPDATAAALQGGWLVTGDLGYLRSGELRVTGRQKDLVLIRGRKYSPSDFEWAAGDVADVRRSSVVAFGVYEVAEGSEILCLVCETDLTDNEQRTALESAIRTRVAMQTGIVPAVVKLVPRNTVPRTSSGKIQRNRMRSIYLSSHSS